MSKTVVLIPAHSGVDAMSVCWWISRSPQMWSTDLPDQQDIDIMSMVNGDIQGLQNDFFTGAMQDQSLTDMDNGYLLDRACAHIDELRDQKSSIQNTPWNTTDRWQEELTSLVDTIKITDCVPGLVIAVPGWMYTEAYIEAAQLQLPDVEIKTVFSYLDFNNQLDRRYFLISSIDSDDREAADTELALFINSQNKMKDKEWTARVSIGNLLNSAESAAQLFEDLGLEPPVNFDEEYERLTLFLNSYLSEISKPISDPWNNPWDDQTFETMSLYTWIDEFDAIIALENNISIAALERAIL